MKIVHLNKNDLSGGAARAANRQHIGLQRAGHDSVMLVASKSSDDQSVLLFKKPMDPISLAQRGLRQAWIDRDFKGYRSLRPSGYELFSDYRSSYASTLLDQIPECDIINLHWIPGFVDYETFFRRVPESTPVVWTLHDLNPFTGGCHYDLGCARYTDGCGACPQLGSADPGDLSHKIWKRKRRLFSRVPASRLHFVAPSRWLYGEAKSSPIIGQFPASVIPNGIDVEDFALRPRRTVRDLLGIPQEARVLLFVAENVDNKRKGFQLLVEAIEQCAHKIPNLLLLSVGRKRPTVQVPVPWRHLGSLDNDYFLSLVYSAADLFAICSLQENFGCTLLEAMACGIASVGFAVGGIRDMIRNGVNGLSVPAADVGALADAITNLLNDSARCEEMGANARRIVMKEYSLELQARRYSELYETLIAQGRTTPHRWAAAGEISLNE